QAGQDLPPDAGPRRHLPGRQDPLDRLSGQGALHPRHRHQSRRHPAGALRPQDRRGAPDDAAAGDVTSPTRLRPFGATTVKHLLTDERGGREVALIDLREELSFSQRHLLHARSVPLSRLELMFARLVPRKTTRIVLLDDGEGLNARAADVLAAAGYTDLNYLDGGVSGWERAGYELFAGVNVPSKAFGEFVEDAAETPSITAIELDGLLRSGADMVVVDSRPFSEYHRVSI